MKQSLIMKLPFPLSGVRAAQAPERERRSSPPSRRFNAWLWLFQLLCLLVVLFACRGAHAGPNYCTASPDTPYYQTMTNMGVSTNLSPGDTIPGSTRAYSISGTCPAAVPVGTPIVSCYYGTGGEVMAGVYSTGVPGLGIRLRFPNGQPLQHAAGWNCDTHLTPLGTVASNHSYVATFTIEFVYTGPITPGTIDPAQTLFGLGAYATGYGLGTGSINALNVVGFQGTAAPRSITCTPTYPSTVKLPSVSSNSIPASGPSSGTVAFSIGLTCSGPATVGISFDAGGGTPIRAATSGVYGNLNEGVGGGATNVGVQLVDGAANPVPLQTRNALGSIIANVPVNYNYAFRYYGLGIPGAGSVSAASVFTFDYR